MGNVLLINVAIVAGGSALGDARRDASPRESAWELTVHERLAARFDAGSVAARNREYRLTHPGRGVSAMATADAGGSERTLEYVIDGHRNPELFLPHELFATLLTGIVSDEPLRTLQRGYYRDAIRNFSFDDQAFWNELERASERLVSRTAQGAASADELCRERHQALQTARFVFGRDTFDRFLYVVIAPSKQYAATTTVKDPAAALLRAERGCH